MFCRRHVQDLDLVVAAQVWTCVGIHLRSINPSVCLPYIETKIERRKDAADKGAGQI